MSPVEICGIANASVMKAACVPLPAPGGPSSISRMMRCSSEAATAGAVAGASGAGRRLPTRAVAVVASRFSPLAQRTVNCRRHPEPSAETCAHPVEVLGRIDAGRRRAVGHLDDDAVAVPERAQLLERLELLDRRRRQRRKARAGIRRGRRRARSGGRAASPRAGSVRGAPAGPECVAGPRNRRAAEVERDSRAVEHHLDHVRIERLGGIANRVACGRDRGIRTGGEQRRPSARSARARAAARRPAR